MTKDYLHGVLDYSLVTGEFTWKKKLARKVVIGDVAGCVSRYGYTHIRIDGVVYQAHRLAFLYVMGYLPTNLVDHRNNIRSDNRWENLREATYSQNRMNCKSYNKFRVKGVGFYIGKYRVRLKESGRYRVFGYYPTLEEATLVSLREQKRIHGEWFNESKLMK